MLVAVWKQHVFGVVCSMSDKLVEYWDTFAGLESNNDLDNTSDDETYLPEPQCSDILSDGSDSNSQEQPEVQDALPLSSSPLPQAASSSSAIYGHVGTYVLFSQ